MKRRIFGFLPTNFKQDIWLYLPVMTAALLLILAFIGISSLPLEKFFIVSGLIGDKMMIAKIIGLAFGINVINFIIALFLLERDRIMAYLLSFGGVFVALAICLKVATIIYFW